MEIALKNSAQPQVELLKEKVQSVWSKKLLNKICHTWSNIVKF